MTRQKALICDILENTCDHLTAEQIYFRARERMPAIAMGTVYRNLGQLSDRGFIRRLTIPGQPDRFDKNPKPHGHLLCGRCGEVQDLFLPELQKELQKQCGTKITGYQLTVEHICPHCQPE